MFATGQKASAAPRAALLKALGRDGAKRALGIISALPSYEPTPLTALPALARRCGVAQICVFRKVPDSDFSKFGTLISVSLGHQIR